MSWELTALLDAAEPRAAVPQRHLWLVHLGEWLRQPARRPGRGRGAAALGGPQAAPEREPLRRLQALCDLLERDDARRARVQALLAAFQRDIDAVSLLVDHGFAPRMAFASELARRVRIQILPATPDTTQLAELFALLFRPSDADWLTRIDARTLDRLAALWPADDRRWRAALLDAITMLCSAVRAAGFSSALRLRMSPEARRLEPFRPLSAAAERLRGAVERADAAETDAAATELRARLAECRAAATGVLDHLEEFGISLHIVFDVDQLRLRTRRIEQLLDHLLAPPPEQPAQVLRLLRVCVDSLQATRSVRALLREQSRQLSRQVAERSAETGEHYITRTPDEYLAMQRAALGGGAVIAGTTFVKFGLAALGLTAFWGGFWAGVNYAASFVIVMLMHWTVATKQPAMTAPAMAARLAALDGQGPADRDALEAFVDEVTHLIRSQMAGIIGNLAACFPLVLSVQLLWQAFAGEPLIGPQKARAVLDSLTLLGPTPLYAAFTGVLLFASSLIAGWVENAFVFHRLHSVLRWHPGLLARIGAERAGRWADWWRTHISGIAANVSLGLMLGIVPVVLQFLAVPLDVRHVTLSSGQLAAALGAIGPSVLAEPAFWWCAAAVPVIGLLNLAVSFTLAFRVALRARSIQVARRAEIYRAILRRLRQAPMSFLRPPSAPRVGG